MSILLVIKDASRMMLKGSADYLFNLRGVFSAQRPLSYISHRWESLSPYVESPSAMFRAFSTDVKTK